MSNITNKFRFIVYYYFLIIIYLLHQKYQFIILIYLILHIYIFYILTKILYRIIANLKKINPKILSLYFLIHIYFTIRLILKECINIFIDRNFVDLFFIPFQIFYFISNLSQIYFQFIKTNL